MADLDELWEQPPSPAGSATDGTATPPAQPSAPPEPSPLEREVIQLRGMVQGLAAGVQQQRQPEPQPQQPDYSWKDQEFLSPDEGQLILNGKLEEFPQRLNRYLNAAAKTVHENMVGEIRKRDEYLNQMRQEYQGTFAQTQAAQQQQAFRGEFFQMHQDLQGEEFLVQQAAAQVAQEFQRQPWAYGSPQQILGRIGEVARGLKSNYLQRWGGTGDGEQATQTAGAAIPAQSPARRAQVETGGSTRIGAAPAAKNPQQKAMNAMIDHVRGGRR